MEDVWAVVKRLPIITFREELGRQREGQSTVTAGAEVTISITMRRVNRLGKEGVKVHARSPRMWGWDGLWGWVTLTPAS